MTEKPEDRRLSVHRGPDWSVENLLAGIPASARGQFASPQARFNYERALAQREFDERLAVMRNPLDPGIATTLKTNTNEWRAYSLALWARSLIARCLTAFADRLLDESVPLDEALIKFDAEAS